MRHPDHILSRSILRPALGAFMTGLVGGILATTVVVGSLHLWATERATVEIDPAHAQEATGVEVEGCHLRCAYQPARDGHPARIVVGGDNPGTESRMHAINVMAVVDEPAERISRIAMPARMVSTTAGALTIPAKAEGTATIDLPTILPAGARIVVDIGKTGMAIRPVLRNRIQPAATAVQAAPATATVGALSTPAAGDPLAMITAGLR